MKPIIGVTAITNPENKRVYEVECRYLESIIKSGGIPQIIPTNIQLEDCRQIIKTIDGLLIPGGMDVSPLSYGEDPHPTVTYSIKQHDKIEIELVKLAREYDIPVIGICRGAQIINVAFGGNLYQDIPSQYKNEICHNQVLSNSDETTHVITIEENSYIGRLLNKQVLEVNSIHHQAIRRVAEGFNVVARARDGIVEAIESIDGKIIGFQWHPEKLFYVSEESQVLFKGFIERCRK